MLKNIFFILIAVCILFYSIEDFGNMYLSIPTFLIVSYNVSDLLIKLTNQNKNNNKKDKNIEFLAFIGVLSVLVTLKDFEQTIGGYTLFWKLAFLSLIFSSICLLTLNKYYTFNNNKKFYNILSVCICFFFLVPNMGVLLNKHISLKRENKQITTINYKKEIVHSRGASSYAIFIKTKHDNEERLDVKEGFYNSINSDEKIVLTLKKGILGHDYVTNIEKR